MVSVHSYSYEALNHDMTQILYCVVCGYVRVCGVSVAQGEESCRRYCLAFGPGEARYLAAAQPRTHDFAVGVL